MINFIFFLIPIVLQPDFVDIPKYEICFIKKYKFEILKVYTNRLQRYRDGKF